MSASLQSNEELVESLIASHFNVASLPGRMEWLAIPEIQGWQSSIKQPANSLIRWAGSDPGKLPSLISRVCEHFDSSHTPFTWLAGPRCQAAGINSILIKAGFRKTQEMAGMVISLTGDKQWDETSAHSWEITDLMDPGIPQIMTESFQTTDEVGCFYHELYTRNEGRQRSRVFAAAPDGENNPRAIAYLSYIPESKAVLLRAAGTLAAFRGQGLYTCLVKRRLREAKAAGYRFAFVHAYRDTSAPVFARLGFTEICALDLYTGKGL